MQSRARTSSADTFKMEALTLSCLEFYSGVGGWTMALEKATQHININRKRNFHRTLQLRRLAFFDHSDLCNDVLQYNFPTKGQNDTRHTSVKTSEMIKPMAIEKLTIAQLEKYNASIWAMSPPCQPHTRQHTNQEKDLLDPRSNSFLHLCSILETMHMEYLPKIIFLENVVGFEKSNSFHRWRKVLMNRQYAMGHFHLTPTQCLIPNDRPRYYCIAILRSPTDDNPFQQHHESSSLFSWATSVIQREKMVSDAPLIHTHIEPLGVLDTSSNALDDIRPISDFLEDTLDESVREQVSIPSNLLRRSASWCFDIIQPSDRRSSCFTHSYGKFARGTGSVLYIGSLDPNLEEEAHKRQRSDPENESGTSNRTLLDCIQLVSPEERKFDGNWSALLQSDSDIRYLTGTEMARLMGFPIDNTRKVQEEEEEDQNVQTFRFPPTVTMKQQWKLIGNSLNVTVTAAVVELGLSYYLHLYSNLTKTINDA